MMNDATNRLSRAFWIRFLDSKWRNENVKSIPILKISGRNLPVSPVTSSTESEKRLNRLTPRPPLDTSDLAAE